MMITIIDMRTINLYVIGTIGRYYIVSLECTSLKKVIRLDNARIEVAFDECEQNKLFTIKPGANSLMKMGMLKTIEDIPPLNTKWSTDVRNLFHELDKNSKVNLLIMNNNSLHSQENYLGFINQE